MAACELKCWEHEVIVAKHGLGCHFRSSFRGQADLNWSDKQERRSLLAQLCADAGVAQQIAKKALRGYAKNSEGARQLQDSVELLAKIMGQNIEQDVDGDEGLRIRKGTAKGFDGYMASIVVDTQDGVILSTGVQPGNTADREQTVELVEAAGGW